MLSALLLVMGGESYSLNKQLFIAESKLPYLTWSLKHIPTSNKPTYHYYLLDNVDFIC